jgi:hypothetical protein
MAEPIEKIIAQGRRVNVEAKVALERAAESRAQMDAKLSEARAYLAKCREFLDTPPHKRKH